MADTATRRATERPPTARRFDQYALGNVEALSRRSTFRGARDRSRWLLRLAHPIRWLPASRHGYRRAQLEESSAWNRGDRRRPRGQEFRATASLGLERQ